ncbi:hypothetical protein ACQUFG_17465, partial [Enterococcus gallinarum]|uniref:hypothetical protein n=1 Tax=Enterococcus gallinarum TaxID=1353 RepID=UPI003D0B8A1F
RDDAEGKGRHELSDWLKSGLVAVVATATIALCDSFGQTLYAYVAHEHGQIPIALHLVTGVITTATGAAVGAHRLLA